MGMTSQAFALTFARSLSLAAVRTFCYSTLQAGRVYFHLFQGFSVLKLFQQSPNNTGPCHHTLFPLSPLSLFFLENDNSELLHGLLNTV